jgi:hypothetical protein
LLEGIFATARSAVVPETNWGQSPGTLKNRLIVKVSEFSSKYNGWNNTGLHFINGGAAAQMTPGETAILREE